MQRVKIGKLLNLIARDSQEREREGGGGRELLIFASAVPHCGEKRGRYSLAVGNNDPCKARHTHIYIANINIRAPSNPGTEVALHVLSLGMKRCNVHRLR